MSRLTYGWPEAEIDGPPVWEDPSFDALLSSQPALLEMRRYLPPAAPPFERQEDIDTLASSYRLRGYGRLLYALVRTLRPRRVVELGVFEGFSALSMAAALRDNAAGCINGYDLFEAYPYRRADRSAVAARLQSVGLDAWAKIHAADVFSVEPGSDPVDMLHVDISNTGDTFRWVFDRWSPKVSRAIVLEGGGPERDRVEWMRKYGKPAIAPAVEELRQRYAAWSFTVLPPFPSMTIACREA